MSGRGVRVGANPCRSTKPNFSRFRSAKSETMQAGAPPWPPRTFINKLDPHRRTLRSCRLCGPTFLGFATTNPSTCARRDKPIFAYRYFTRITILGHFLRGLYWLTLILAKLAAGVPAARSPTMAPGTFVATPGWTRELI